MYAMYVLLEDPGMKHGARILIQTTCKCVVNGQWPGINDCTATAFAFQSLQVTARPAK